MLYWCPPILLPQRPMQSCVAYCWVSRCHTAPDPEDMNAISHRRPNHHSRMNWNWLYQYSGSPPSYSDTISAKHYASSHHSWPTYSRDHDVLLEEVQAQSAANYITWELKPQLKSLTATAEGFGKGWEIQIICHQWGGHRLSPVSDSWLTRRLMLMLMLLLLLLLRLWVLLYWGLTRLFPKMHTTSSTTAILRRRTNQMWTVFTGRRIHINTAGTIIQTSGQLQIRTSSIHWLMHSHWLLFR